MPGWLQPDTDPHFTPSHVGGCLCDLCEVATGTGRGGLAAAAAGVGGQGSQAAAALLAPMGSHS